MLYVGVDIAVRRPSTVVVLDSELNIVKFCRRLGAEETARYVAGLGSEVFVAVDAPIRKNCGLMKDKQFRNSLCPPPRTGKHLNFRLCEYELSRRNLPIYLTRQGEVRSWVQAGLETYDTLGKAGFAEFTPELPPPLPPRVMCEYYPYAAFAVLLGNRPANKKTKEGQRERAKILREHGVQVTDPDMQHDQLDALVGALTARFLHHGKASWVGHEKEGFLVVPGRLQDSYR